MTTAEKLHSEAIEHLAQARERMRNLASVSDDWSAATLLEIEFDSVEETCRDFGRCQFGLDSDRLLSHS